MHLSFRSHNVGLVVSFRSLRFCFSIYCVALLLSGCGSFQRSTDATNAKSDMLGLRKDQVLACMGIPKRKAHDGTIDVWEYASSDEQTSSSGITQKFGTGTYLGDSTKQKSSCTVSIVMTSDRVSAVHYNGPSGGLLTPNEECGYAVANCVAPD
jgi:hypothetical protein